MKEDKQLDRVSYSFGIKINKGNYESTDVHCFVSRHFVRACWP